jgi:ATP-dependent DNA helicase PIF1
MEINEEILKLIPNNERTYLSTNSIMDLTCADFIPVEYLNRLKSNGWPLHWLSHKVGTPMMLLQNLDRVNGIYNGMQLLIRRFAPCVIEVEVMTRDHKGHIAFVPRIPLTSEDAGLP